MIAPRRSISTMLRAPRQRASDTASASRVEMIRRTELRALIPHRHVSADAGAALRRDAQRQVEVKNIRRGYQPGRERRRQAEAVRPLGIAQAHIAEDVQHAFAREDPGRDRKGGLRAVG
jgi:hypothetical protein